MLSEFFWECSSLSFWYFSVLASVGIGVAKDSDKCKVIFRDRSNWYTSRKEGMEFAASKVIIDEANDHVMGVHILGPNAEEAINIFALVMWLGLKASDIKNLSSNVLLTTC
ncbi:thioredoxin and glutathione reductase [Methanosarcina barkeri 227]|uniref:Thioredoxin and glutathione reductase n=3 Tax=Methanosarcina barkeri TaxID=2208 RepID=A0A0E3QZ38_METBA|nr:thioredoxin and glutathione reductase [Methanosarcina barkeri MS]AKB59609.1 thioredoxin and glutathione reductase [Methanosarcina barkeri 227]AKJ40274.1 hypothetical protein MCM1_3287 [Methanosarcina barkeri CM1]